MWCQLVKMFEAGRKIYVSLIRRHTQTHPNTTEEHCNLETEFSENKVVGEKGMLKFEETIYHLLLLAFPPPVCFDPQGIKHPV